MMQPIRVVQYGLGPIGRACAAAILAKEASGLVQLVGAVDVHPALSGGRLAKVLGDVDRSTDIEISSDLSQLRSDARPDVVLHATGSFLEDVFDQLAHCLAIGCSVISSAEELFYPYDRHPGLASSLDRLAKENGVSIMATGVNPGFAMDVLALAASSMCVDVESISIERVVDAAMRREPLQRKIGAGLAPSEFEDRKRSGSFGHIGLRESAQFVAHGLGWNIHHLDETLEPVIADVDLETSFVRVRRGDVAGIHHRVVASGAFGPILRFDLKMYIGAEEPSDTVAVKGTPPIDLVVRNGIFGDSATVAAMVNAIPLIASAAPGLRLSMELPVPRAFGTRAARST